MQVVIKVSSFYARANAKFVPPVTLTEYSFIRKWEDINVIIRQRKGCTAIEQRDAPEDDGQALLFETLTCLQLTWALQCL